MTRREAIYRRFFYWSDKKLVALGGGGPGGGDGVHMPGPCPCFHFSFAVDGLGQVEEVGLLLRRLVD